MLKMPLYRITKKFIKDTILFSKGEMINCEMTFVDQVHADRHVEGVNANAERGKVDYKIISCKCIGHREYP